VLVSPHPVEEEIARVFDEHGIVWQYGPHTFVLERSRDASVHEACTPDFVVPELGVYVKRTVMRNSLLRPKRRKARKARGHGVRVEVLSRGDLETLADRWKLRRLAHAARARPTSLAPEGARAA
jgi:hypothetical protein